MTRQNRPDTPSTDNVRQFPLTANVPGATEAMILTERVVRLEARVKKLEEPAWWRRLLLRWLPTLPGTR